MNHENSGCKVSESWRKRDIRHSLENFRNKGRVESNFHKWMYSKLHPSYISRYIYSLIRTIILSDLWGENVKQNLLNYFMFTLHSDAIMSHLYNFFFQIFYSILFGMLQCDEEQPVQCVYVTNSLNEDIWRRIFKTGSFGFR